MEGLSSFHSFQGLLDGNWERVVQVDWSGVNASSLGNRYHGELLKKRIQRRKSRYGKALRRMT
jgi:hypothetical protein